MRDNYMVSLDVRDYLGVYIGNVTTFRVLALLSCDNYTMGPRLLLELFPS